MDTIDLRSDTVTHPTPEMREAMANTPVGDDVYGEDPIVNQLEAEAAEMLGKEAGLFVTSGTQGNLISVMVHCGRGDEVVLGDKAHTFVYEAGGIAALGGVQPHTVPVHSDGTLALDDIRHAIRGDNIHFPRTRLIALENTQGTVGGMPLSVEYTNSVAAIAREHHLKLHIDGARIFNAAVAEGVTAAELIAQADSMTFCLSKGLCAPVGSILVGSKPFIAEARRARKMLGGGLRQVGILAAAGLIAIHQMVDRLGEDHTTACLLAEGLATLPHISLDLSRVKTNFVFFDLLETAPVTPEELVSRMQQDYHIMMRPYPGFRRTFRAVTHYWITPDRVQTVVNAMREILA
ncbi:MAG TPA: low-specificity L-threonine aldolase [Phototrophicaceae bacterium]|jgi:threonine aldolase|nr:low-specificity L-threonine aldolase [Phototrophicaceae bacterium]